MAIVICHGVGVGAGKSYYATCHIYQHLIAGGTVVVTDNFVLQWEKFKQLAAERSGVVLEDDQYMVIPASDTYRLPEVTPAGTDDNQVLLVLDEAQGELNTRDTRDPQKRALFSWMCQSRHQNNDLLFLTQHMDNVDSQVRRLATSVVRVRNMATFKALKGIWPFYKLFLWSYYDQGGTNYLDREWVWHDKAVFGIYVSKSMQHAHKRVGAPVARKKLQRVNRKKPMKFLLILFVVVIVSGLSYGVPAAKKMFGKEATPVPAQKVAAVDSAVTPKVKEKAAYLLSPELFRGTDGHTYLRTHEATYEAGRMSRKGFVEMVEDRVARVRTPTGEVLFVVGDESPSVRAMAAASIAKPVVESKPQVDVPKLTPIERAQAGLGEDDRMERVRAGLPPK